MEAVDQKRAEMIAITVPSKPEYVGWARRVVEGVAQGGGLAPEAIEDVKLAVGEACTNAIVHGSPAGEENLVSVQCQMLPGTLTIVVKDQGPGFRFAQARTSPPPNDCEGGRGLVLIRMLMDEVSYRHGRGGGTLKMVKRAA